MIDLLHIKQLTAREAYDHLYHLPFSQIKKDLIKYSIDIDKIVNEYSNLPIKARIINNIVQNHSLYHNTLLQQYLVDHKIQYESRNRFDMMDVIEEYHKKNPVYPKENIKNTIREYYDDVDVDKCLLHVANNYNLTVEQVISTIMNIFKTYGPRDIPFIHFIKQYRSGEDRVQAQMFSSMNGDQYLYYAIFDGHGSVNTDYLNNKGESVSLVADYCRDYFHVELFRKLWWNTKGDTEGDLNKLITDTFLEFDKKMYKKFSEDTDGCTASIVLVNVTNKLVYQINLGDSRSIVFDDASHIKISDIHNMSTEKDRIEKEGGLFVGDHAIFPNNFGLATTRALGDFHLKHKGMEDYFVKQEEYDTLNVDYLDQQTDLEIQIKETKPSQSKKRSKLQEQMNELQNKIDQLKLKEELLETQLKNVMNTYHPDGWIPCIPSIQVSTLTPSTQIIISSDGLFDQISEKTMVKKILNSTNTLKEIVMSYDFKDSDKKSKNDDISIIYLKPGFYLSKPESINSYNILSVLGKGDWGQVFLATKDNQQFAIKAIKNIKNYENELNVYKAISEYSEENIYFPKYYDSFRIDQYGYIVLEYIQGNTLFFYGEQSKYIFNDIMSNKLVLQCIKALKYLYQVGYVHNDLRSDNVILTDDKIVLIDLGSASHIDHRSDMFGMFDLFDMFGILSILYNGEIPGSLMQIIRKKNIPYIQKLNDAIAWLEGN